MAKASSSTKGATVTKVTPMTPVQPTPAASNPGRIEMFQATLNPTPTPRSPGFMPVNKQANTGH